MFGLSKTLKKWFLKARAAQLPISGQILHSEARETAKTLGSNDFRASNRWLQKRLKWANLSSIMTHGEAMSVDLAEYLKGKNHY